MYVSNKKLLNPCNFARSVGEWRFGKGASVVIIGLMLRDSQIVIRLSKSEHMLYNSQPVRISTEPRLMIISANSDICSRRFTAD